MSAKHTPGPWVRDRVSGLNCDVRSSSGRRVALCWGLSATAAAKNSDAYRAECDANAVLIAAAPDLLAIAQFFLRGIEGGHIRCAPYIDFDPNAETLEIKSPAARLREAIAKATGEAA
jgi:hypothetical protein